MPYPDIEAALSAMRPIAAGLPHKMILKIAEKRHHAVDLLMECDDPAMREKAAEFDMEASALSMLALEAEKNAKKRIRISHDYQKFSRDWPESWKRIRQHSPVAIAEFRPLWGILNLDTGKESEALLAISGTALHLESRRNPPFASYLVEYPQFPSPEDIVSDLLTLLRYHGIEKHPAVWVAHWQGSCHVHLAGARTPLFPNPDGTYVIPEPLVVDEKIRPNGKTHRQLNHSATCDAAAWGLCRKYGYLTDGLLWDDKGRALLA